jgi:hypothetical protein
MRDEAQSQSLVFYERFLPSRKAKCRRLLPGTQGNLSLSSKFRCLLSLIVWFCRLFNRVVSDFRFSESHSSEWWCTAETNEEQSGTQRRFNHERRIQKNERRRTREGFWENKRNTQKDAERHRKTQKDAERHRKTKKDTERHRKTQREKRRTRAKDLKKPLNGQARFKFG